MTIESLVRDTLIIPNTRQSRIWFHEHYKEAMSIFKQEYTSRSGITEAYVIWYLVNYLRAKHRYKIKYEENQS